MITVAVNSKENFQNLKIKILLKTIEIWEKMHQLWHLKVIRRESRLYVITTLALKNQKQWYRKYFKLKILQWKWFYFSTEIVSFPYGHPKLTDIQKEKNKFKEKFKKIIKQLKFDMLKREAKAVSSSERMHILRSILSQAYITSLILKKRPNNLHKTDFSCPKTAY